MEQKRCPPCVLCQGDHGLGRCEQFRAQSAQQRYEILMREKRCLLCFQRGHVVAHCVREFTCAKCSKKHHTLIHEAKEISDRAFLGLGEEEDDDWEGAEETLHYGMLTMPSRARVSLRTFANLDSQPPHWRREDGQCDAGRWLHERGNGQQTTGGGSPTQGANEKGQNRGRRRSCHRIPDDAFASADRSPGDTGWGKFIPAQVMERLQDRMRQSIGACRSSSFPTYAP